MAKLKIDFYPINIRVPKEAWEIEGDIKKRVKQQKLLEKHIVKALRSQIKKGVLRNGNSFVQSIGTKE